ncbi:DUF4145 domain-containing protein [Bacillus pseudomycoides]|uniref:DUF4145 domain-containing protein n=1 Tax=Bacillus pseudomycoides TaxID=64104 RepID=UPI000BEC6D50|nr:DUF4145 domain-containing protein [Bacillus pseudomycoides]PEE36092.1 hypothetical protein COO02_26450 [Bacillus pseudomycoides]PGA87401.1 hypothetical protein COL91_21745 [Bacillus pseudomycoides]PHF35345.1 hypothetical protein COF72_25910 [Bacillus pseudomycoides]
MEQQFLPPECDAKVFTCPHCKAKTKQHWTTIEKYPGAYRLVFSSYDTSPGARPYISTEENKKKHMKLKVSVCDICEQFILWHEEKMIYPPSYNVEDPISDMPEEVEVLYNEAREIISSSPKSACALLRLALEKLLIHLGCSRHKKIAENIRIMQEQGKIDEYVHAALESVRIIGNKAVHPGKINVDDQPKYAYTLFSLLNYVVDELISRPARVKAFRESIG